MIKTIQARAEILGRSSLFKNSSWGIIAQASQTLFITLFFIIVARIYSTEIFAAYIIANILYQLVSAFSTMGLSPWFIRELSGPVHDNRFVNSFFRLQLWLGVAFYLVSIGIGFTLYDDKLTRVITMLFGVNIIFDNIINVVKFLNIVYNDQKKTFLILSIESFLKFLAAAALFIYPFSIEILAFVLIVIRFVSLNLFLKMGASVEVSMNTIRQSRINYDTIKSVIFSNWPFIIIGGISIINWRLANIVISKTLGRAEVANYEIAYKVFSIAQIVPIIISTTVFPKIVKLYSSNELSSFKSFYQRVHIYYMFFGLVAFTFAYSFSNSLIPWLFGTDYLDSVQLTQQMFFTILVFPTALLQANVLVAMRAERYDMILNVVALIVNALICIIGIHYIKSVFVVNVAIFSSFLLFRILQDVYLIKRGVSTAAEAFSFYTASAILVTSYVWLTSFVNIYLLFVTFWLFVIIIIVKTKKIHFR